MGNDLKAEIAERLFLEEKEFFEKGEIVLPTAGKKNYKVVSDRNEFSLDVTKSSIAFKCNLQKRYGTVYILRRLDVNGPPHTNPDGTVIECPHMHIYREGFGDKWAVPLSEIKEVKFNVSSIAHIFSAFLEYCNIIESINIQNELDVRSMWMNI